MVKFWENLGKDSGLEEVERLLRLHGLETGELIHQYYWDRLTEQNQMDCGTDSRLTVKACLCEGNLNLLVVSARHLKSLQKDGKSST